MSFNNVDVISKINFQVKSKEVVKLYVVSKFNERCAVKSCKMKCPDYEPCSHLRIHLKLRGHEQHFSSHAAKKCCSEHGYKMLHVTHSLNTAANSIFAAFFCFLTIKYTFETWFPRGPRVQQVFAEILCLLYNNMSSQEEHIKLNDKEKFKLIEFYKKDPGKNVSCIKS